MSEDSYCDEREYTKLRAMVHSLDVKVAILEQSKIDSEKALGIAELALKHSQSVSNEWRKENIDQRGLFPNKEEVNGKLATEAALRGALEGRIYVLEKANNTDAGRHSAFDTVWMKGAMIATLALTALSIIYKFLTGK